MSAELAPDEVFSRRHYIQCAIAGGMSDREIAAIWHIDAGEVLNTRLLLDAEVEEARHVEVVNLNTAAGRWKVIFDRAYPDSPATRHARREALLTDQRRSAA